MRRFGRRGPARTASDTSGSDGFVLVDLDPGQHPEPDPRPVLRRIAAEGVILSDQAAAVLAAIRAREGLGFVAPRGGPLVRRFFALRDQLPVCTDPVYAALRHDLDVILHHHAMLVSLAMDLLAFEWRSERIGAQLDALDGMGEPAQRLDRIYALLA